MPTFNNQKNEFEQRIQQAKQEISTILAGERKTGNETNLQAATYITARSQSTSDVAKETEPLNRKERAQYNQKVKPEDEKVLIAWAWAKQDNLWIEEAAFNKKYAKSYIDEGAEQKVYLKEDGKRVNKVNTVIFMAPG